MVQSLALHRRTFIAIAFFVGAIGCNGKRAQIHFVVPVEYRGYLVIQYGRVNGQKSVERDDCFTYEFPASGVLNLADEGPFFTRPYTLTVAWTNGDSISFGEGGGTVGNGTIGFWDISNDSHKRMWYFVGTDADYQTMTSNYAESRRQFLGRSGIPD